MSDKQVEVQFDSDLPYQIIASVGVMVASNLGKIEAPVRFGTLAPKFCPYSLVGKIVVSYATEYGSNPYKGFKNYRSWAGRFSGAFLIRKNRWVRLP